MAITLPAPTLSIVSAIASPTALPTAEATSLTAGGGVNFANNGAILLRVCVGSSTTTLSALLQRSIEGFLAGSTLYTTGTLAISTNYIFGPFSPSDLNDANGNFNFTLSVYTGGITAGLYKLPGWVT